LILIRGQAGTEVEIEFISAKSSDNERKIVTLKREEIKLEDRAGKIKKSLQIIMEIKLVLLILPSFYIDFNAYQKREDDYKSSSGDVKKILEKFNNENVEALVLDLRNNGGGAFDGS
jgi:carboxyl-terminal processing protease